MTLSPRDAARRRFAVSSASPVSPAVRAIAIAAAVAGVAGITRPAGAIVYRDDVTDAMAKTLGNQAQFVGACQVLTGGGTGTVIDKRWVLTAAHVSGETGRRHQVHIGGVTYTGTATRHPSFDGFNSDIALIELDVDLPASIPVVKLNTSLPVTARQVWVVGFGKWGNWQRHAPNYFDGDGNRRAGTNVTRDTLDGGMRTTFNNANTATNSSDFEGSTGPGDSGGPMYFQQNNTWYVTGATRGVQQLGFDHTTTAPFANWIKSTTGLAFNAPESTIRALTWKPIAGVTSGGLTKWNTTSTNFTDGQYSLAWENQLAQDVTFGTAGAMTGNASVAPTNLEFGVTSTGVTARGLTFSAGSDFTISSTRIPAGTGPLGVLTLSSNAALGGDPVITTHADADISALIGGTSATITKAGTARLVLSGANTYTGKMQVSAGTLQATKAAALAGHNAADRVSVASGARLDLDTGAAGSWSGTELAALTAANNAGFAAGSTLEIDTADGVSGTDTTTALVVPTAAHFEKTGAGQLNLSAAQNYTGTTKITAGILGLSGSGRLPTNANVQFANNAALSLGSGVNQTLAGIAAPANGTAVVSGAGTLTLVTPAGYTLGNGAGADIDLAGLTGFVFNNAAQTLAVNGTANTTTDVQLAVGNTVTASAFNVAVDATPSGQASSTSNLTLGKTNTFNVGKFQVGGYHGTAAVAFGAAAGSTFNLRGAAGGSTTATDLTVGFNSAGDRGQSGTLDLSAGSVSILANAVRVGVYETGSGSVNNVTSGTFNFAAGDVNVDSIVLARSRAGNAGGIAGKVVGTVNQTGGVVRAGTVTLGEVGNAAQGSTNQTAAWNLNGTSAVLRAKVITGGALTTASGNLTATRTINFDNGSIETYASGSVRDDLEIKGSSATANGLLNINLAPTGTHQFYAFADRTLTVRPTAILQGAGGTLTKGGPGTMLIESDSTYTGQTFVDAGMLVINGSNASSGLTVADGAHLGGSGTLAGSVTSTGDLAPGNSAGTMTFGGLTLADESTLTFDLAAAVAGRDLIRTGALSLGDEITLNVIAGAGFGLGTYSLIDYTGALSGAASLVNWNASGIPANAAYAFALGMNTATGASSVNLVVTAVPEPAALAGLMLLGGAGAMRRRRA